MGKAIRMKECECCKTNKILDIDSKKYCRNCQRFIMDYVARRMVTIYNSIFVTIGRKIGKKK